MDENIVKIGGDFTEIFNYKDYLAMINIQDEATCILRCHLIIEEFLNIWSSKLTDTEDLYIGTFFSFKSKLVISRNLGLSNEIFKILEKINLIRNRFSHRKGYKLENSEVNNLKTLVNEFASIADINDCEEYDIETGGQDSEGTQGTCVYQWYDSDNRIRFIIIFVILMLKLTYWIQVELNSRNLEFIIKSKR